VEEWWLVAGGRMVAGGWWLVAGVCLLSFQFLLTHWIIEDKREI
jgi:hypothetical protein